MSTIVHFDISAENTERAAKFYSALFGWKINPLPGPMNYSLIETSDNDGNPGIGGGIGKTEKAGAGITIFIGVASIDEAVKKLTALGGTVVTPKQALPGWGQLAVCLDTEGNKFGLFEEMIIRPNNT